MRITGNWQTREVWIDGRRLDPRRSQQVWNHSPDGFNWGYAGSGPAQLALAILLVAGVDDERAVAWHQRFKFDTVATWPQTSIDLELDVAAWLAAHVVASRTEQEDCT
jgi:Family of unknown function (DUF6166)